MVRISLVTPSFNQGAFLKQNLESVARQSDLLAQHVVMDGGSSDESVSILKEYEARYNLYWESKPDRGQSDAINQGLKRCEGEVLNWLNSDDFLEPKSFVRISGAFENPSTNIFIGRSNFVKDGKTIGISRGTDVYDGNLPKTIGKARIDQPEHWWRRSVIEEIGPLNPYLHYIMDRDWWIKYLLKYGLSGIVREQTIITNFRLHSASKTESSPREFFRERDSYFYSLAHYYGRKKLQAVLAKAILVKKVELTNMPILADTEILDRAFDYYLFELCEELYQSLDFKKAKIILKSIDRESIEDEDLELLDKIAFRMRLPKSVIRFARK